jgi:predicted nucleotidyltransferase
MKLFLNRNVIVENYTAPSMAQPIDEIDDIANSISDNIAKEVSIPNDVLNSFKIKDTLEPQIWQNEKLNATVKSKLMKIADDFYKGLKLPSEVKMKDVIFTGSLANFNWSKFSDVDLHIVLDFSQLEGGDQFKEDFFWAQKALWNQEHNITIFDYPVEIYAQDIKAKLVATAVYSVKFDKWILKPEHENFKINKKVIKNRAEMFIERLKDIRDDYKAKDYQNVVDKVAALKDKIKKYRTAGLDNGGEFSIENLVFKVLRRTPFMDILDSYKAKAYDTLMSVEEVLKESILTKEERRDLIIEANDRYATKRDYFTTLFKVTKARQLYGGDEYWENVQDGQWVGAAIVNIHGIMSKISTYNAPAGQVRANDLGMRGENPHYLEFRIMAGRGIEHKGTQTPNLQPARTRGGLGSEENEGTFTMELPQGVALENGATSITFGLPKPGSPASDAAIKTYLIYGDVILDFVKSNMKDKVGYVDGKGAEVSAQAMANNPTLQKKKIKKDLEMELGRRVTDSELEDFMATGQKPQPKQRTITLDPDKAAEFEKRQADAVARREKMMQRRNK